ncbi:MAG: hypothetical protein H6652_25845 [Ardenticatenaceae bacterium]|nr:hypothetical protein [Ardenticatenaceae bacterium]
MVQDAVQREVETLLENYGTEYWDDRDVTYDNLIWGSSGIEIPIKRILFQVELIMQDSVSKFMPEAAEVITAELERTLEAHEILSRLRRAAYEQEYNYAIPGETADGLNLDEAFNVLVERVERNFRHVCQQATMYELMKPERSVHHRLDEGERELSLNTNERLLDVALNGVESVRREMAANMPSANSTQAAAAPAAVADEPEINISILDEPAQPEDLGISLIGDSGSATPQADLEMSYADKLDNVAVKVNRIFGEILNDLFSDDDLLPRLRRLFWLEATKAERDFNTHIVKPMLKQHDRNLQKPELREAMEMDLENVSDLEELMRVWDGLHKLENSLAI